MTTSQSIRSSEAPAAAARGGRLFGSRRLVGVRADTAAFSITARATSAIRHYPELNSFVGSNDSAAMNLAVDLGRKTTFRTSVSANYVSNLTLDTFLQRAPLEAAGEESTVSSIGLDNALDWTRTTYGGTAEVTRTLGPFSSLTFMVGTGHSQRPVARQRSDEQSAGVLFARSIGRDIQLGTVVQLPSGRPVEQHRRAPALEVTTFNWSVERKWRHSPFRQTAISLSGGPSLLQQKTILGRVELPVGFDLAQGDVSGDVSIAEAIAEPVISPGDRTERLFRLVGGVRRDARPHSHLERARRFATARESAMASSSRIPRRWIFAAGWFDEPVSSASAGSPIGDLGLGTLANRYGTSFGAARLQLALARSIALQAQYFRYRYDYAVGAILPEGWVPRTYRQGVRVGIVIWTPVQRG